MPIGLEDGELKPLLWKIRFRFLNQKRYFTKYVILGATCSVPSKKVEDLHG